MKIFSPMVVAVVVAVLASNALAQDSSSKAPVPDAAAPKSATDIVNQAYKDQIVKAVTPKLQKDLAQKLLQEGKATTNDVTGRFALLTKAKNMAVQVGDIETAFAAIDCIAETTAIDSFKMKLESAGAASRAARSPDDIGSVFVSIAHLVEDAVAIDRYDVAAQASDLVLAAARRRSDPAITRFATLQGAWVRMCKDAFDKLSNSRTLLAADAANADANYAIGRFRCFHKGDWEEGLVMLRIGSDAALKAVAIADIAGPSSADDQAKLGDDWWAISEKEAEPIKSQVQVRAVKWYRSAFPTLSGLVKAKIEARLRTYTPPPYATSAPIVVSLPATNPEWSDFGLLAKGTYRIEISGRVNLHNDEASFIVGPAGKEFAGRKIGTVSIKILDKEFDSAEIGRDISDGRAVEVEVTEGTKLLMKINDISFDDNKGSFKITVTRR